MKEFKRKVFQFKLDGEEYTVKTPSVRHIKAFEKKRKAAEKNEESDGLDETINFLEGLGLPSEIAWELEPEHLTEIVENITGQKK